MKKIFVTVGIAILLLLILIGAYFLPPVRWRVDEWVLRIKYTLNPPQSVVFVPGSAAQNQPVSAQARADGTLPPPAVYTATPAATLMAAIDPTQAGPTETPAPTLAPTIPSTPLPGRISLKGVVYEDQHGRWNYCAPANLAMALSYWGWKGDRDVVGPVLKPDPKDKNVMPYEMVDYIQTHTDLRVASRVGGDLDTLKRFIAAGFPVLVEKGTYLTDLTGVKSWMGPACTLV